MNHEVFQDQITANVCDLSWQLAYADWLDEQGDPLADYVRLQSRFDFRLTKTLPEQFKLGQRRQLLRKKHPDACRDWDRLLNIARSKEMIREILDRQHQCNATFEFAPPASEEEVLQLGQLIGCALPVGYRRVVREVCNGGGERRDRLLSIAELCDELSDERTRQQVRGDFPFSLRQALASGTDSDEDAQWYAEYGIDKATWLRDSWRFADAGLAGTLVICRHLYGDYRLVVRGELRGAVCVRGCDVDGLCTNQLNELIDVPEWLAEQWLLAFQREVHLWRRYDCECGKATYYAVDSGEREFCQHCKREFFPSE